MAPCLKSSALSAPTLWVLLHRPRSQRAAGATNEYWRAGAKVRHLQARDLDIWCIRNRSALCFRPVRAGQNNQSEATGGDAFGFPVNVGPLSRTDFMSCPLQYRHESRCVAGKPESMLQLANPPIDAPHRLCVPLAVACSSTATRASMSSSSTPLIA